MRLSLPPNPSVGPSTVLLWQKLSDKGMKGTILHLSAAPCICLAAPYLWWVPGQMLTRQVSTQTNITGKTAPGHVTVHHRLI